MRRDLGTKSEFPPEYTPILAAAVEAAGAIVAANVAKGSYYTQMTADKYGQDVAAIAGQIMVKLVPSA